MASPVQTGPVSCVQVDQSDCMLKSEFTLFQSEMTSPVQTRVQTGPVSCVQVDQPDCVLNPVLTEFTLFQSEMTSPVHTGPVSCVQVDQHEFDQMLSNYRLMSARNEKQEFQLKALTNVSQHAAQTETMLKLEKKRCKQFESAYIASEAKLGHLINTLLLHREDRRSDVDTIESLLCLNTEDLYTGYTEVPGTLATGRPNAAVSVARPGQQRQDRDLETDDAPISPTLVYNVSDSSQDQALRTKHKTSEPLECKFQPGDLLASQPAALAPESSKILESVMTDKKRLQGVIKDFMEQEPEAWKAYLEYKQYEDMVHNLRLEVASLRITNTELQHLLVAKQGNHTDKLTQKLLEQEKLVEKLRKELKSEHILLHCINKEYAAVKADNQQLRQRPATDGAGRHDAAHEDYNKLCQDIASLRTNKADLEQKCWDYRKILETLSPPGVDITDPASCTISWSELWDENQKLKNSIDGYRHDLEQKQKDEKVTQAQLEIFQEDLQKVEQEKQDLKKIQDVLKTQVNDLNQRHLWQESVMHTLQNQVSKLQTEIEALIKKNQTLDKERLYYKGRAEHQTTRDEAPWAGKEHMRYTQGAQAVFAGGTVASRSLIEADGAQTDSVHEAKTPHPLHQQHSSPAQLGQANLMAKGTPRRGEAAPRENTQDGGLLECPQCFREFKPTERHKFEEHKKKCVP